MYFIVLGLMVTSAFFYHITHFFNITIDIRNICVFLAPLFSSFTTIATYLLTKELKDSSAGLVSACLISIVPGYISRSVAGSYDNEGIAIFCMLFTYWLWIRAIQTGSMYWAACCSLAYFYMVSSWGGYVFLINLIPLHVLVLMICGRFSHKIYVAYSTVKNYIKNFYYYILVFFKLFIFIKVFCLGTILSMQISFVGFQPIQSSEHMAALGVFGLCQIVSFYEYTKTKLNHEQFEIVIKFCCMLLGTVLCVTSIYLTFTGSKEIIKN